MTIDTTATKTAKRDAGAATLLRIPALRRLFVARTISVFGDMIVPVALAFAVLYSGGGATGLGIILAARVTPEVLLLLLGGVVGDRYPRRAVLILSNSVACVAQLLTPIAAVIGIQPALIAAGLLTLTCVAAPLFLRDVRALQG